MLKWLRGNTASKSFTPYPELDFRDPDSEKFAVSLSVWRKSLEAKRSEDIKLDQNDLTFMAPEALAGLKDLETARRKVTVAKKRAATLKAKAKEATTTEKPAAKKPVAKKPAAKPAAKKTVAKKATDKKPVAKKPVATTALKKTPDKPVTKKVTTTAKKPAAKPKAGTKTKKI
jgi:hypothetical protein